MIVQTNIGQVQGLSENGVNKYLGIPYAEAPIGERRFKKPVEKKPIEGVIQATQYSSKCPQLAIPVAPDNGLPQSEDCLYLNIWTSQSDNQKKPVLFWIFGGGLSAGEGSTDTYDGTEFAKNGDVIVVTFNYRVGVFGGFFNFAGLPGFEDKYDVNVGLYDVLTALKWVNENIEAFGGDKNNITICGESAGASIAALLLCWPKAQGLFAKAALESTFNYPVTAADDTMIAERILESSHVSAEAFINLSADQILQALSDSCNGNILACGTGFQEEEDFAGNIQELLHNNCADVPVLVGFNHDEGFIFVNPQEENFAIKAVQTTGFLFESVISAILENSSRTNNTFVYRYDFVPEPLKAKGVGALHSAEMPCVFHTLSSSLAGAMMEDPENAEKVSMAMHQSWIRFLQKADPGWGPCTSQSGAYMCFDAESVQKTDGWRVSPKL